MEYNLKEIRQLYNLTQEEFAFSLGITREMVNKMEKGRCGLSKATLLRVKSFLSDRKSEESSHFGASELHFFGRPAMTQPYHLERQAQKWKPQAQQAPLVGIKAQAGYVRGFEQTDYLETLEKYTLPPGVMGQGAVWSYFEVDGDSMEPTIHAGDMILASQVPAEDWREIKDFCIYIILTADALMVKRVYRKDAATWVLISDNEEGHPQMLLPLDAIRQVWVSRRHIRSRLPLPREVEIRA